MLRRMLIGLSAAMVLVGCQTPPDIQQLQDEKSQLQSQLDVANQAIQDMKQAESGMLQQQQELNRVIGVLDQEKSSRVVESTSLRGQVRGFVQAQIDGLKQFMLRSNLLDYIGGEQVKRVSFDEEPVLVVDMANTIPADGTITGVGATFRAPGAFSVKVMRKVEGRLVVVWESLPLKVDQAGTQHFNFAVSVGVRRGDVMAYYLAQPGMVGFDTGTSDSRYLGKDLRFGQTIRPSSLQGKDQRRSYSIGVYGLLNTDS